MSRLADYLYAIALTLWVGALCSIGYIAAPTLFVNVADRGFAAWLAAKQFEVVAWLGMVCAVYLLMYLLVSEGVRVFKRLVFWLLFLMFLLTIAGHFGVTPIIEQLRIELAREVVAEMVRSRFETWHGIASVLWLVQSALGLTVVTQVFRR